MTQMHKGFLLIGVFLYAAFVAPKIYAATPDAVNQVLQQGSRRSCRAGDADRGVKERV